MIRPPCEHFEVPGEGLVILWTIKRIVQAGPNRKRYSSALEIVEGMGGVGSACRLAYLSPHGGVGHAERPPHHGTIEAKEEGVDAFDLRKPARTREG